MDAEAQHRREIDHLREQLAEIRELSSAMQELKISTNQLIADAPGMSFTVAAQNLCSMIRKFANHSNKTELLAIVGFVRELMRDIELGFLNAADSKPSERN
jgi:hypothetical protein